jgi:hypothetical protein
MAAAFGSGRRFAPRDKKSVPARGRFGFSRRFAP